MKVHELIALLKQTPMEAEVIYRCCSEYEVLDADDIMFRTAEQMRAELAKPYPDRPCIAFHKERFMEMRNEWITDAVVFQDLVVLPGN